MTAGLNHLWQSSIFAAAAGLLTLALQKNRAEVRYWLWFSASSKFLVPFSLLMALGSQFEWAPAPEAGAVSAKVVQIVQPFPSDLSITPPASPHANWTSATLFAIWMCGLLGTAVIRLRGWLRVRAVLRASIPIDIPAPVEVRTAPGLLEPGVVGLWRPVLLLPAGILDRLTPPQFEAVLAHELCHVRRRDNLLAAIHMMVEALFWFHPLVWWIGARLVEERERACDEGVLSLGSQPRVYAEAIVNVCKLYAESPPACVSGVTGSNLKKRIEAIMTGRIGRRPNLATKTVLTCAAAAALAFPIWVGVRRATAAEPTFEVASVKPCKDESERKKGVSSSSPGRLSTGCIALTDHNHFGLIQRAYVRFAGGRANNPFGILAIQGGPSWIRSEMYEINARAEGRPTTEMMQGPMLQALLEDRFRLKIHRETRSGPVYELVLGGRVSKLKGFEEGSCTQMPTTFPMPPPQPGERYCRGMITMGTAPAILAEGSTLGEFCRLMNLVLDRPVIDRTGLTERFDIQLSFSRDQATKGLNEPDAPAPDPNTPGIFTAIQEQLGLKLVPATGAIESLVIDHAERPSEN